MNTPNEILDNFQMPKPKKTVFGNYRIEDNKLIYRAQTSDTFEMYKNSDEADNKAKYTKMTDGLKDGLKLTFKGVYDNGSPKTCTVADIKKHLANKDTYGRIRVYLTGFETNEVARKLPDGTLLGNGSILPLVGRKVSYGNVSNNTRETEIQRLMQSRKFTMIPFRVFEQADLDISKFKSIIRGPEEHLKVRKDLNHWEIDELKKKKRKIPMVFRHFVGSHLFEVDGATYLFDIDRREIKHGIFNPFLVCLKTSAATIEAAYTQLKPKEVLSAEVKGLKVVRQGEWFFIPCKAPKIPKFSDAQKIQAIMAHFTWEFKSSRQRNEKLRYLTKGMKADAKMLDAIPGSMQIKAGNNRPNTLQLALQVKGVTYATGKVEHSGREHEPLILKGWYTVHANTSVGSFTLTGDVD